jgi:ribose-phosphate pyrophosphokinase
MPEIKESGDAIVKVLKTTICGTDLHILNCSHTPVLVDDIISIAATMTKTVGLLRQHRFADIICLATHGLFAGIAYGELRKTGATRIVTANTVPHPSNALELASLLAAQLH